MVVAAVAAVGVVEAAAAAVGQMWHVALFYGVDY